MTDEIFGVASGGIFVTMHPLDVQRFPDRKCVREIREYLHIDAHYCGLCECKGYLIRFEFALLQHRAIFVFLHYYVLPKSSSRLFISVSNLMLISAART